MATSYDFLGKVTATGSASVMTLSGIPQTHKDIEFIFQAKTGATHGASGADITLNGDTGSVYHQTAWLKNGTTMYGQQQASIAHFDIGYGQGPATGDGMMGFTRIYISDYASAVDHPGIYQSTSWDNNSTGAMHWGGNLYAPGSPAAITSVTWTGVYTIEANCSICAYGINYS